MNYLQQLDIYKKFCVDAISDLLVFQSRETVRMYQKMVDDAKTDREVSRIMTRVREVL